MKTLGAPIEGAEDIYREWAVMLARTAEPEVRKVREQRLLKALVAELEATQMAHAKALTEASATEKKATAARDRAHAEEPPAPPGATLLLTGGVAAVAGIILAIVLMKSIPGGARYLGLLALAIGLAGAALNVVKHRRLGVIALTERARIEAERARARRAADEASQVRAKAQKALDETNANLDKQRSALAKVPKPRALEGLGRAYLPIVTMDLVGHKVAVDESGCFATERCTLPDFSADEARLRAVEKAIEAARVPPILLAPSEVRGESVAALYGEEALLSRAVEDMVTLLKAVPTVEASLRIIPKSAAVAKLFASAAPADQPPGGLIITSKTHASDAAAMARITELANRLRGAGGAIAARIGHLFGELEELLALYGDKRRSALSDVHERLLDAMSRTSWSHTHFYCPKTNLVPEYLSLRLGFQVEDAHTMDQATLLKRLYDDEQIGHRLASDPQIVARLTDAYNGIDELGYELRKQQAIIDAPEDKEDTSQFTVRARALNIVRALRQQLEQYVGQYRRALVHALTGRDRTSFELSPQSRLFYDPKTDTWSSPVTKATYKKREEVEMGAVLTVRDELLIPLWTHLWTEKADFRRSEMFRTNEQLLRMSEKESEKLLQVSSQFKDDMRMVRENVLTASAELESKVMQIKDTVQGLGTMGLLPLDQQRAIEQRLAQSFDSGILHIKRHAESKELLLALEPQAQAERRGTSADPIQDVTGPSLFFAPATPESLRLTLSRPTNKAIAG
jgi:hypothetical protein